jgi:hypothetical protein
MWNSQPHILMQWLALPFGVIVVALASCPELWLLFSEGRCWECYCCIDHIHLLLCPSDCSFVIILSFMLYKLKFFAKDMVALLVTVTVHSN